MENGEWPVGYGQRGRVSGQWDVANRTLYPHAFPHWLLALAIPHELFAQKGIVAGGFGFPALFLQKIDEAA